jgi:glucan 1,3-beta-glucosidase
MKIRGVNLGGWFVLERWMSEPLFKEHNVVGNDETVFVEQVKNKEEILQKHYETFITKDDIVWLKEQGVNLVRLPIPWWLYGEGIYVRSVEYIDKAIAWFEEIGIDFMLDLHTAPGCQNGFDNGGIEGVLEWPNDVKNIEKTIEILVEVTKRYQGLKHFHSIGVLNEPFLTVDIDIVKQFYVDSYNQIREVDKDVYIVFHDSFRIHEFVEFFKKGTFDRVILDAHIYQYFSKTLAEMGIEGHMNLAHNRQNRLCEIAQYVPIIIGEWSLGLHKNTEITDDNFEDVLAQYSTAQLKGMDMCMGHIFWSYKIKGDRIGWDFRDLVDKGIIKMKEFRQ